MAQQREGFTADPDGIRELMTSPMAARASLNAAHTVQRVAEAIAPRNSGTYARSFRSSNQRTPTLTARGGLEVRAGAIVENTAPHAAAVEARSNVLTRAAKGVRY